MSKAVIAGYVRSPFHFAGKGALARVRPDDLAATVVKGLLDKTGVKPEDIEDLILGCAFPEGEQGLNVARLIGMIAGLPQSVAGATLNRFCGSSMQAIHMAAGAIAMDAGQAFICAGIESMSRVPMMGFNPMPNPALAEKIKGAYGQVIHIEEPSLAHCFPDEVFFAVRYRQFPVARQLPEEAGYRPLGHRNWPRRARLKGLTTLPACSSKVARCGPAAMVTRNSSCRCGGTLFQLGVLAK